MCVVSRVHILGGGVVGTDRARIYRVCSGLRRIRVWSGDVFRPLCNKAEAPACRIDFRALLLQRVSAISNLCDLSGRY